MIVSYQYTLLGVSLACCVCIFWSLRANLLHPLHALWWGVVALLMLLAGAFPRSLDAVAHVLGVTYPPTLFLFLAVVVLLVRMLLADMERSRMTLQIRSLNQHQARLALRVRLLEQSLAQQEPQPKEQTKEQTKEQPEEQGRG